MLNCKNYNSSQRNSNHNATVITVAAAPEETTGIDTVKLDLLNCSNRYISVHSVLLTVFFKTEHLCLPI